MFWKKYSSQEKRNFQIAGLTIQNYSVKTLWMLFRNEMTARKDKSEWLKRHKQCLSFNYIRKSWKWKLEGEEFRDSSKCPTRQGIIVHDIDSAFPGHMGDTLRILSASFTI